MDFQSARSRFRELHHGLIAVTMIIASLGVYNLHSATSKTNPDLYLTQLAWLGVGAVAAGLALTIDYRVTRTLAYPIYVIVCGLLAAVLVQGHVAGGAQRWLRLGPLTLQPSELAKLATILCLARHFAIRIPSRGYSIGMLIRPLNISRPMLATALLVVYWNAAWLVDPLGQLARLIHGQLGERTLPVENLLWFRLACGFAIVALCLAATLVVVWLDQRSALLSPWPTGRKRFWVSMIGGLGIGGLVLLWWYWDVSLLQDPVAVTVNTLNQMAMPGGELSAPQSGFYLRVIMCIATLLFLLASLLSPDRGGLVVSGGLVAPVDLLAFPALLILVEPDLGTAGIVILVGAAMVFVAGVQPGSLAKLSLMGAALAGVSWFGVLKDYQKRRILTFIDPESDIQGAGWNAVQSIIAVGSGQFSGKGHGSGTQTQLSFLPEQHTDFAFSVWAEEQGFIGCMVLLALYLLLLAMALGIAAEARDTYGALLATGVAALVFWHWAINVGMVIGVAPVVGLTLPLFSYGGSSVVTMLIAIGLLLNVHWRQKTV